METFVPQDENEFAYAVLEVTMRDGNPISHVAIGISIKGFRSDYEGWKRVV